MAMPMPPTFTTADRRKRLVTYGKASRYATSAKTQSEDPPSPERRRKPTGIATESSGRLHHGSKIARATQRTSSASRDIFDVPSDDEFTHAPAPKPVKRPPPKQIAPTENFDVPSSDDEAPALKTRPSKTLPPSSKSAPAPVLEKEPQPANDHNATTTAPRVRRTAIPHTSQQPNHQTNAPTRQKGQTNPKSKAGSRATTPAPPIQPTKTTQNKPKAISNLRKQPAAKLNIPQPDIFDVPSSDEGTPVRIPRSARPVPLPRAKSPHRAGRSKRSTPGFSSKDSVDSDDSNASRKRKRHLTTNAPAKNRENSLPQRNRKYQKKEDSRSTGHESGANGTSAQRVLGDSIRPAINKPMRTRTRTQPGPFRPLIGKGQSSPAKLHSMLAVRTLSKPNPSSVPEEPDIGRIEDETMYDIPEPESPDTPHLRITQATMASSVTPRQKTLFNNLLNDPVDATTPMPPLSKLRLTSKKPASTLARSISDVPQTGHTRKLGLINKLKTAVTNSEEEDSDESGEDLEDETVTEIVHASPRPNVDAVEATSVTPPKESQTSQASQASQSSIPTNRVVRTYASQRSYLEEANAEDGMLLAMEADNEPIFASQKTQDGTSDDEDEPASQVQGIHELRRTGERHAFDQDLENSLEEISDVSKAGFKVRRSAMLVLTTKLANEQYLDQFLESRFADRFLAKLSSNDEIIFDFTAAAAIAFILQTSPSSMVLDQIHKSDVMATLTKLLDSSTDIQRTAKDRKTGLSRMTQTSVAEFRTLVQESPLWSSAKLVTISPQLVAIKALELLVVGLRTIGRTGVLVPEAIVFKLIEIASSPCDQLKTGKATAQDSMLLDMIISILEALSVSNGGHATWSNKILRLLADQLPVFFETTQSSSIKLATRLCMTLTNNKPKACDIFAGPAFVQPLMQAISCRFDLLASGLPEEELDNLTLLLGTMINLAEFSDKARLSAVDADVDLLDALVRYFLEGSERADQADSVEATQSSIPVGYLTVLLGNLCMNDRVRDGIRTRLPGQNLRLLMDKIREFVLYHQKVDRETNRFEGEEGRETSRTFTARLLMVVERLEKFEG